MALFEAVQGYIDRKRSLGVIFERAAMDLRAFAKRLGDVPLNTIEPEQVLAFLNGPRTSRPTWRTKFTLLKHFFEYCTARGMLETLPMPTNRPAVPRAFVPYIYQKTQIRCLLSKTRECQRLSTCSIDAPTLRMLILFLYATGMLVGEALRLQRDDVDLKAAAITIRGGRFNRERRIPIGADVRSRLKWYTSSMNRRRPQATRLFANKDGSPIRARLLVTSFQRLRRLAGLQRHDGAIYQPRMHDLRYTFAVHRLSSWLKQRANMNRMLPALAAYLGQVGLGYTERYLLMTPERFRNQLVKLSPLCRKGRRWCDDRVLMKFLDEL